MAKPSLYLAASAVAVLIACAKPVPDFAKLHEGMSEAQVVAILGKPDSVGLKNGQRVLNYDAWDRDAYTASKINRRTYEVRLVDDRVVSFGREGN